MRVYSIVLKKPIPKHLQFGGNNVRTKYTGQDKHIQQDRDEKNKLRQQRHEEQNKRDKEGRKQYEREEMGEFRQQLEQQHQQQQQLHNEEERLALTEQLFTEKLEDVEIQTPQEYEELKDIQWTNDRRKRKKEHSDNEETQQTIRRKVNKHDIDADVLKWTLLNRATNILPTICLRGEFKFEI